MKFERKTLSDIGLIVTGKTPSTKNSQYWNGGIHFVTPKDIQASKHIFQTERNITEQGLKSVKGSILPAGSICVSCIGNIGYVGITTKRSVSNQQINSIIVNNENDRDFVYYLIKNLWLFFKNYEGQSTALSILNKTQFSKIQVDVPSLNEQKQISSILSRIDDKIELNNAINNNLQQQADTLFKVWFIDNPDSLSWQEGVFADLIDAVHSGDWGKETPIGTYTQQVYCIRGADIPSIKCGDRGKMPTRFIQAQNLVEKKLCNGDIVVEISGGSPIQSTGRAAPIVQSLIDRYDGDMVCTNFCKALTPKQHSSLFVYYYWQYLYDKGVFFTYENGTTGIKNLNIAGILENERIHIPPTHMIEQFDSLCGKYWDKIASNGLESERLADLHYSLLPKLMSGEIDVSKVEL